MLLVLLVLEVRAAHALVQAVRWLAWDIRAWWAAAGSCLAHLGHSAPRSLLHVRQALRSWPRW